jgi:hypothetical protein
MCSTHFKIEVCPGLVTEPRINDGQELPYLDICLEAKLIRL